MIFEVYLDDKILYYPNDETYEIFNSKLELALNEAGSFEFDIPSSNLRYDDFKLRQSMIRVDQNGVEIFYGEVREVTQNFDFTKHVYVVGELAFLFDSIQPQRKYQTSPLQVFESLINNHNSQVEDRKKFELGFVQISDTNNYILRYTNREDTLTAMREKLCKPFDGNLRIRKDSNGTRYLDLVPLENYGSYCKQEIQFGENLMKHSCNMTTADIATCVIPLGKRLDNDERTEDAIEGLDENLTIVGTTVDDYHKNTDDDFVQLDSAVKNYGFIRVVKNFDDITVAENLKEKAIKWLKTAQYETMTLELNALDLSLLDANIDTFDVGDTVHAWALPFEMDATFPVQKKTIYLNDLSKNMIVLGSTYQQSFTSQASSAVNSLTDEIPEVSPILQGAKDNAMKLLNGSVGGHVIMKFDSTNSYVEEMLICNGSKEEDSTQKWVWNLNGLGYMHRANIGDPWSSLDIAMTMDGHMVANFITSGLLRLTGSNNGTKATDGAHLQVYDGNTLIGSWGKDGIVINKGSLNIGGNFSVDTSGNMTARSGYIGDGASGWSINTTGINSYGGPNSLWDTTAGMYVGADGIRSNASDRTYIMMYNGALSTNSSFSAQGITTGTLILNGSVYLNSGSGIQTGATGSIYWYDSVQKKTFGINAVNGIVTYIGSAS